MVGKNNQYLKSTKEGTRVESYSIKKFKVGAASVVIGASIFFGAGAVAQASEEVSNNTIADNIINAGTKADVSTAPVATAQPVAKETTKEDVAEKVVVETPKVEAPTKVVDKAALKASIERLEKKLTTAKNADEVALKTAREELAKAKEVFAKADASQDEVNTKVTTLSVLTTVVAESEATGKAVKDEAKKAEEKAKAEAKESTEVKEAKKELTQVTSEAEVTNVLANEAIRKNEVKIEAKPAVEKAVAKNEEVIKVANNLLGSDNVTKEQIAKSLEELSNSIKAVYAELENAGAKRNGKFDVVLADVAEKVDEAPLTQDEQADHWKKYKEKNTERLKHQIKWFDITSKTAVVENLDAGGKLKVGTKFKQELTPGYVVEMEVTALKPFNSTDVYKERGGAGYDPNAQNVYKDGTPAEVKVVRQGGYSVAKTNGIDTGGTTVIQSVKNGANVGVEFKVKATLNGKEVPANVVFATGEEAGSSEIEIYKTDGDGFELVTELSNDGSTNGNRYTTMRSYTAETYENRYDVKPVLGNQTRQLGNSYTMEGSGKPAFAPFIADKAKGFRSTEITEETVSTVTDKDGTVYSDGLGTQVFGPAVTHRDSGMSTPVVLTRNAKNLGVYILSSGQQGAMFGFMVLDEGDAPASYGRVGHAIAKGNGITQPYLGSKEPDIDIRTEKITDETAFKYDDVNGEGGDEGARQLMGDKVEKGDNYKLKKVNDGTYSLTFDAHLGGGKNAFVNGWIDFNNNGKFDENEGAGAVEVTKDGEVTLTWTTPVQNVDVTATKLATRLRIANDKADVKEATGIAYSGEVEDFQIQQTIPPRGTKEETYDIQGATQRSTIKFNAYGNKDYNFEEKAAIDETVQPQIVKADGSVVTEAELVDGYYVVPGQGKYKVTAKGKDVNVEFVPEATFVGDADGITIRRTDTNGATTGWGKIGKPIVNGEGENGDQLTLISDQVTPEGASEKGSMDGRYIPHVMKREIVDGKEKSNDIQGAKQTRTPEFKDTAGNKITPSEEFPVKLVDPKTGKPTDETEIPATKDGKTIGTYTITPSTGEVVFTPNKDFIGEPDSVKVSFTGKVGVDKDGQPVTSTGTVTYQPKVKPVTPTAEGGETTKPQGVTQEKEITFTAGKNKVTYLDKNDNPVEVEKSVPMNPDAYTLLGEDGQPATEVPAKDPNGKVVGTYTLKVVDGVPTAVFTPTDKTYVGDVKPVTIQGEDENGTKATATYTPHITPVEPTAKEAESTAKQGDVQKGTPTFTPGSDTSTMKSETLTLVDDSGNPVDTLPAMDKKGNKVGDYTVDKQTGEVIFTPTDKKFSGKVLPARVRMQDSNGTPAETTYTPNIVPVEPQGEPAESTAPQGVAQEGTVTFTGGKVTVNGKEETVEIEAGSARLLDKNGNPLAADAVQDVFDKDGNKIGEYRLDPATNKVTYTPTDVNYVGAVPPAEIGALDKNGTLAVTTYTPNITPTYPTAEEATSVDVQGAVQKGTVEFKAGSDVVLIDKTKTTLLDENNQPAEKIPAKSPEGKVIGEYTLNKETGEVTFTPDPKVPYAGDVVPAKVQAQNTAGGTVETTYTPSIIPVNPSANPATSEGPQGVEQTGTVEFIPGNPQKAPETPAPIVKSTIKLLDKSGNEAETVTVTDKDGKEIGVYSLVKDPNGTPTGEVKFTPTDKTFVGKVEPVIVQAKDTNSTVAKTTYTPNFTGVTPTAEPKETKDVQGATQTGKPTFTPGDAKVPMDDTVPAILEGADAEGKVVVKGEGTYTVAPDGTVTFVPEKTFTGKGTGVTVKRVDKNGTEATAKYTPTVLTATPKATPAESTDIQGKPQKGLPQFLGGRVSVNGVRKIVPIDETKALELIDPKTGKPSVDENGDSVPVVVPGEGKYEVKNGVVIFTPEKSFTGKATGIDVQRVDANGTPVSAKYTPTVTPVTPTSKPAESTDIQGKEQKGTPEFTPGNPEVPMDNEIPATFEDGKTTKTVEKVGTYTVAKDGTVTFTPEKSFTGTAPSVTVKRVDKNGTPATATYTPTVTAVTPEGTPAVSEGAKGQTQTGTPTFKAGNSEVPITITDEQPAQFVVDGNPVTDKEIPAKDKDGKEVGKYTIDPKSGKVTFTPNKDFTGTPVPATVRVKDVNGTPVKATYTPTVRPDTEFVVVGKDGKETKLIPSKDGEKPSESIPGYKFVKTEKDKKGNTKHIYEKVTTSFKDKKGNLITVDKDNKPVKSTEEGEQPKKDIPGYRFVETKKLPNGDVEHVYEKVTTSFKDKKGNLITVDKDNKPVKSTEEGEQPKKDIPGYRFVETKKLPNGDVEHVYEKVTPPTPIVEKTTSWVDEDGNELKTPEIGDKVPGDIPGYEFVRTITDGNGNVKHVFKQVSRIPEESRITIWTDEEGNPIKVSEKGTHEHGEVPGYEFVKTIVDKDGKLHHIFRGVPAATPKAQVKRLANTGTTETNTGLAGLGLGILGGLLAAARRRKEK